MGGQAPIDFQLHNAGNFGDSNIHSTGLPVHSMPLDIDNFLIDQNAHNVPGPAPPQLNNAHFMDFSYPFGDLPNEAGMEGVGDKMDQHRSMYNNSARGSISEHRASVVSIPRGRASFSSHGMGMMGAGGSLDDSDENSPESARPGGQTMGEGFGDDFNVNGSGAGDGSDLGSKTREDKNDPTPAWSELKTKAGKERKRLPLACIACRRKKIRCSGEKPACKHCLRSRIPCVYKVTTRKAAPRTDYMAMLDKRLKRMEDRIIKIVPKDEQDNASVVRAQVKPAIPGTIPVRSTVNRKRAAEEAFGAELETWARPNPEESGVVRPNILKMQEAEETRLLTEGADALPSQEIQEHLAEVFFDNLYGQAYHLLHKPSYMRKLKAGTVPPVLILAVCGISARFSTHPQLDSKPAFLRGEQWAKEAREIVMRRYDWPNITILTCLLLLGLHEFGTCYGGRSWALGGMAVRMAFALQLHRDLEYDPLNKNQQTPLSFVDREIRRRTMWACFLMDRFNSSGTDRPMVIREETIEVQLPICEKYFQLDMEGPTEDLRGNVRNSSVDEGQLSDAKKNMGVAAYMIRAIALHGRITLYLFQGGRERDIHPSWHPDSQFAALEREAEAFPMTLPESLQYLPENINTHETEGLANQFLFLHIVLQRNIMTMNHHAVQASALPSGEIPIDFVGKMTSRAFDAGKQISQIILDSESHTVTAPFAGHCAVMSSVVQMAAAFSKNPAVEQLAKRNLATNVRFIAKMKRFWGTFHYLSENLREQFRACADAANLGPNAPKAPVFQYGDWFDRYPHGVSQSDFEDPATNVKKEKGDDAVLEAKSDLHTVEDFFASLSPSHGIDSNKRRKSMPTSKKTNQSNLQSQSQSQGALPNQQQQPQASRMQMRNPNPPHGQQIPYQQISPTDAHRNIFVQPAAPSHQQYYPGTGQDLLFPPQQQPLIPQLDRQLVFGAYDGSSAVQPHMHQGNGMNFMNMDMMNGDVSVNNNGGHGHEQGHGNGGYSESGAWFMPFNMEPPNALEGSDDYLAGLGMAYGVPSVNGQHGLGGTSGI